MNDGNVVRGIWSWWPLRLIVLFFMLITVYIGCQLAFIVFGPKWQAIPKDGIFFAAGPVTLIVMIVVYRVLVRWMEKRSASELGAHHAVPLALAGALIGLSLFGAVCATIWACGMVDFKGWGVVGGLPRALGMSLMAGIGEEIIFRGAVYRLLEEGFGTLFALIISGALFGLLHAGNPGATIASTLAIAFEAGILLGAAYALTRSLWLPIGLHFGWNFAEGGIFGTAVSGHAVTMGLINAPISGPDFMTGGKFGPEASLPAVGVCMTVAMVMLVLAAQRGEWKPMRFRLRT